MKYTICCLAFAFLLCSVSILKAQTTPVKADQTLEVNRKKIDSLDKKLIELLGERERVVREIGIYKSKNNIPPLQPARFQQVLNKNIEAGAKQGLSADFVTELMNAVHKESLRIEEELKNK
ncbi:chorismate mutase [Mucilaginibacter sp. RS28]|uniref:chorismate mutase n=1 Tax=Mucilaginibacter straminoryzae TaxID=2932774 RepID=A0A9X2B8D6_9SPHI|nr:chorismate mutase [Mucilaginibacter straminoryzae]MCJ8208605.1 chorismate mutase [Mucilaginibacter straminoryzae]